MRQSLRDIEQKKNLLVEHSKEVIEESTRLIKRSHELMEKTHRNIISEGDGSFWAPTVNPN